MGVTPLLAVMTSEYVPAKPAAGVPARTAPPSAGLLSAVKVTPEGSVPLSDRVAVGVPVEVNRKEPAVPTVKAVLLALVMAGAAWAVISPVLTVTKVTA